jgi:hypothetical protein
MIRTPACGRPNFDRRPVAMLLGASFMLLVEHARALSRAKDPARHSDRRTGAPFFLWLLARPEDWG